MVNLMFSGNRKVNLSILRISKSFGSIYLQYNLFTDKYLSLTTVQYFNASEWEMYDRDPTPLPLAASLRNLASHILWVHTIG